MWHDWLARCNDVGIEVEIDECYLTRRKYNQGRVTKTGTVTILGLYERATQLGVHLQVSVRVLTTIRKSKSRSTALTVKCLIWVSGDTDTCLALSLSLSLSLTWCVMCFSTVFRSTFAKVIIKHRWVYLAGDTFLAERYYVTFGYCRRKSLFCHLSVCRLWRCCTMGRDLNFSPGGFCPRMLWCSWFITGYLYLGDMVYVWWLMFNVALMYRGFGPWDMSRGLWCVDDDTQYVLVFVNFFGFYRLMEFTECI